jgi:hypothetical protein
MMGGVLGGLRVVLFGIGTNGMIVCAEAYSRMAQVQQYLDPNTREQYAQGHLDQRVEQVLQEIRDLSIAGAS